MKNLIKPLGYLQNEQQQLALIYDYNIMNDDVDNSLNRTLYLVQKYYQIPMVGLVFVGKAHPFFKASLGFSNVLLEKQDIFSLLYEGFKQELVVLDMSQHREYCHHPCVTDKPRIRFCASVPICVKDRTGNKAIIGQLFIMDTQPHDTFDSQQQETLCDFAETITDILTLNQKQQRVKRENDVRIAFLKNISHEILTPINGIVSMLDSLAESELTDEQRQYLTYSRNGLEHMLAVSRDVSELSHLLAGTIKFESVQVNLQQLCEQVLNFYLNDAKQKQIEISLRMDKKLPTAVYLDYKKVRRILVNLLKNAIDFTPEKGKIVMRLTKRGENFIDFQVIDSGVGLSSETQVVIFDAYLQADKSTHKMYASVGLGLSVCKAFAEGMGGSMKVASRLGQGSGFTLRLPLKAVAITDVQCIKTVEYDVVKSVVPLSAHVLLVDDCKMSVMKAKKIIQKTGCTCDVAVNGQQAVDMMMSNPTAYQLILMDHQMPIMDGVTATRVLKENLENLPPIVAVTAHAVHGDTNIYLEVGMQDYLAKPYEIYQLEEKIKYWLTE